MAVEAGMTLGNVLRTLRTRWYVAAAGTLVTLVGVLVLSGRTGVYTTTADVQLIPPERMTGTGSPSPVVGLVALAGMVQREVGDDVHRTEPVSPDAPLAGLGVKSGTLITLPDSGGQWNHFFEVPALRVQTVAATAEEATRRRDDAIRSIEAKLLQIQAGDGVALPSRVTVRVVPKLAPVVHERGSVIRAGVAGVVLGLLLTVVATVQVDRLRHRRAHSAVLARFDPATTA
jgi:hypothetical protein